MSTAQALSVLKEINLVTAVKLITDTKFPCNPVILENEQDAGQEAQVSLVYETRPRLKKCKKKTTDLHIQVWYHYY